MKKILFIAAAALISASAFAQTVSSANVVGYSKGTTPAAGGFDIVALNVFGTNDTVDLQAAVANIDDLNAATSLANADKLYVWDNGYTQYGLFAGTSNYWMISTSAGWLKAASAAPTSATIDRGAGTWFATGTGGSSTNLIVSGDVPNDGTYSVDVSTFSLIAYPFSASINLTDLAITNATASTSLASADKVYVWNGGYTQYGLFAGTSNYWMISTSAGWLKAASAAPSSADIDLGKGIWYNSVDGAKTIGFTQNYNID